MTGTRTFDGPPITRAIVRPHEKMSSILSAAEESEPEEEAAGRGVLKNDTPDKAVRVHVKTPGIREPARPRSARLEPAVPRATVAEPVVRPPEGKRDRGSKGIDEAESKDVAKSEPGKTRPDPLVGKPYEKAASALEPESDGLDSSMPRADSLRNSTRATSP